MRHAPPRDDIGPDTPLRLDVAAAIAFPDGSITARSLLREAHRGNLAVMHIAGKTFTTLAEIGNMCAVCRVPQNRPASISDLAARTAVPSGSSNIKETNTALARAKAISQRLKRRSPSSSPITAGQNSAKVIPIKS